MRYRSSRKIKIFMYENTIEMKSLSRTKNEFTDKVNRLSVMRNSVIAKCCHRVLMRKTY